MSAHDLRDKMSAHDLRDRMTAKCLENSNGMLNSLRARTPPGLVRIIPAFHNLDTEGDLVAALEQACKAAVEWTDMATAIADRNPGAALSAIADIYIWIVELQIVLQIVTILTTGHIAEMSVPEFDDGSRTADLAHLCESLWSSPNAALKKNRDALPFLSVIKTLSRGGWTRSIGSAVVALMRITVVLQISAPLELSHEVSKDAAALVLEIVQRKEVLPDIRRKVKRGGRVCDKEDFLCSMAFMALVARLGIGHLVMHLLADAGLFDKDRRAMSSNPPSVQNTIAAALATAKVSLEVIESIDCVGTRDVYTVIGRIRELRGVFHERILVDPDFATVMFRRFSAATDSNAVRMRVSTFQQQQSLLEEHIKESVCSTCCICLDDDCPLVLLGCRNGTPEWDVEVGKWKGAAHATCVSCRAAMGADVARRGGGLTCPMCCAGIPQQTD